ncbi:MAG: hypothetical protein ACTSUP_08090 [Candidatus Heimdallarchaeaceae archaeon]
MKFMIKSPNDCPFRSNTESGGTCNIKQITCEQWDNNYPEVCPLLDDYIVVGRIKNNEETNPT